MWDRAQPSCFRERQCVFRAAAGVSLSLWGRQYQRWVCASQRRQQTEYRALHVLLIAPLWKGSCQISSAVMSMKYAVWPLTPHGLAVCLQQQSAVPFTLTATTMSLATIKKMIIPLRLSSVLMVSFKIYFRLSVVNVHVSQPERKCSIPLFFTNIWKKLTFFLLKCLCWSIAIAHSNCYERTLLYGATECAVKCINSFTGLPITRATVLQRHPQTLLSGSKNWMLSG